MGWRLVALVLLIAGVLAMPVWPYSRNWSIYAPAFCWFVAVLSLLVSLFGRRGSEIWKRQARDKPKL